MKEQQTEPTATGKVKVICQVAEDRIRKDNVHKVTKNQILVWPSRWQWLVDENYKMYEAMAGKRPLSPIRDPGADFACCPVTPPPELKRGIKKKADTIMLPPIPPMPAKPSIPVTTNGWYGFLPQLNGRNLVSDRQKWCKVTVGQHNLTKVFGWPDIFD